MNAEDIIKSKCSLCEGPIEFPPEMANQMTECPHCKQQIKLYAASKPPALPAMERKGSSPRPLLVPALVGACVLATVLGGLWLKEKSRGEQQAAINQVLRQNLHSATNESERVFDFGTRFFLLPFADDTLTGIGSLSVSVQLNDAVKKVVSEDRIKNKFELVLRRHNVTLREKGEDAYLNLAIDGLWSEDGNRLTYTSEVRVSQGVAAPRRDGFRAMMGTVWREGSYGYAGKSTAEKAILDQLEEKAESFANKFLAAQQKAKKKGLFDDAP